MKARRVKKAWNKAINGLRLTARERVALEQPWFWNKLLERYKSLLFRWAMTEEQPHER